MKPDPQDAILVALMRGPKGGMTVAALQDATSRAGSTVRNNLSVMSTERSYYVGWVEAIPDSKPLRWRLTDKGREVARYRGRRMKRDDA